MINLALTVRRFRILARRHGPMSPVWRRRFATGIGAVLVGLVALLFARAADQAMALFGRATAGLPWLPFLITPLGVWGLAAFTKWFTPEARGSGAGSAIVALLVAAARAAGAPDLSLVAVNDSVGFWRRHGFVPLDDPALAEKLRSYDDAARFMVRSLP